MRVEMIFYESCEADKMKISCGVGYSVVHFVVEGEGYFNGKLIKSGQGFVINENQWAEYYPKRENPWTYAWVRISDDEILRDFESVFTWDISEKDDLIRIAGENMGNDMYNLSRAYMLLSYIQNDSEKMTAEEIHIKNAENYIKNRFDEINSAADVAEKIGLSRAYLRNLFVKHRGMSTKQYIIKVKLEHAARMLKQNYPVKLVAMSVGYNDQLQFSGIFKKHFGVSPKQYKEQNQ